MIGQRIKQARSAAGLSLRALAAQTGVSHTAIAKYERGDAMPSSEVLLALSQTLGVRVEYFFRAGGIELAGVEYRKHARLPQKVLRRIQAAGPGAARAVSGAPGAAAATHGAAVLPAGEPADACHDA